MFALAKMFDDSGGFHLFASLRKTPNLHKSRSLDSLRFEEAQIFFSAQFSLIYFFGRQISQFGESEFKYILIAALFSEA